MQTSRDPFPNLEDFLAQSGLSSDAESQRPKLSHEIEDTIILWHGTTRSRAKAILRSGFRAEKTMNESSRGYMFFTPDPKVARSYARSKAKVEGDLPAVIMCSIDLNRYYIYEHRTPGVYVFGHECISRYVIMDVEGMPKRQVEKWQGRKTHDAGLTDVALAFNSSNSGIAYWINNYMKLDDEDKIREDHEAVGKIKQWLDEQMDAGRFGEVPDDEILEQVREYLS